MSLSADYNNRDNAPYNYPRNVKPGVSDESSDSQQPRDQSTERGNQLIERKKIASMDERDVDIHGRANRKGNWDYKSNWRYDREAFYRGETQGEAYDREHPDGIGGPGMDPDTEYLQMHKFYLEESRKNHQSANAKRKKNSSRSYANYQNNTNRRNNNRNNANNTFYANQGNNGSPRRNNVNNASYYANQRNDNR